MAGKNENPLDIHVDAGQFLGRVGNSGHSSGPHLHLHLVDHPGPDEPAQRGLPLRFNGIRVHGSDGYNPEVDFSAWNKLSASESAVPVNALIKPPCVGACSITLAQ